MSVDVTLKEEEEEMVVGYFGRMGQFNSGGKDCHGCRDRGVCGWFSDFYHL